MHRVAGPARFSTTGSRYGSARCLPRRARFSLGRIRVCGWQDSDRSTPRCYAHSEGNAVRLRFAEWERMGHEPIYFWCCGPWQVRWLRLHRKIVRRFRKAVPDVHRRSRVGQEITMCRAYIIDEVTARLRQLARGTLGHLTGWAVDDSGGVLRPGRKRRARYLRTDCQQGSRAAVSRISTN